ncbi:hypothetical protein VDP57_10580 [Xanthomonas campestris pv. campestris]|uniref:hypothetical protein n=1 Tax=Xanthomonas campestris TaxID=339 RepID=UPI0022699C64|nr:hypothetical protein [Xanthomonas campestris]MEB1347797.1 hypothetical protein [Xanthomonas campestris pv. campestris]WDL65331.1 hypothetical protein JH269_11905 [Xanthomonas campestris pv. campestris]
MNNDQFQRQLEVIGFELAPSDDGFHAVMTQPLYDLTRMTEHFVNVESAQVYWAGQIANRLTEIATAQQVALDHHALPERDQLAIHGWIHGQSVVAPTFVIEALTKAKERRPNPRLSDFTWPNDLDKMCARYGDPSNSWLRASLRHALRSHHSSR